MKFLVRTAPLLATLALSACAVVGSRDAPTTTGLTDQAWIVTDIAGRSVAEDTHATLRFGSDHRLTGDASCNRYMAAHRMDQAMLRVDNATVTRKTCAPAAMDQERRFLDVLQALDSYRIDASGALVLSTPDSATITARRAEQAAATTAYRCSDGRVIQAVYPTSDTARLQLDGRTIDLKIAVSASGARYVGDGWQWWTKGMTEGMISRLAPGEAIASGSGVSCTAA